MARLIAVTGKAALVHGDNYGFYGIIDQLLWRVPNSEDPKGIGWFGRIMGAPEDRNLIDFYADTGLTFTGMIPGRPDDAFAIGFAYTGISDDAGAFDVDFGSGHRPELRGPDRDLLYLPDQCGLERPARLPVYLPAGGQRAG